MSPKFARLAGIVFLALFAALTFRIASAQTTAEPQPQGMKACAFEAMPAGDQGLVMRDAPSAAAKALPDAAPPQFRVIGVKDGWLLIEGAAAKGWVDGRSVTTRLYRQTLKAAADNASRDLVYLLAYNDDGSIAYDPANVPVSRIVDCSGPWVEVEIRQPGVKTLSGQPASSDGTMVGWTDRSCPAGPEGEGCKPAQFNYPWSPLPAGIVECNFSGFSKDADPAGLNVRAGPDANARILGRLPPPIKNGPDSNFSFLSEAQVIGYKKGWFLIESGSSAGDDQYPAKFVAYSGRGWVAAGLIAAQLLRRTLKAAPNAASADVLGLKDIKGEPPEDGDFVKPRRVLACSGDWLHVEFALKPGMKPLMKTDAPPGAIRGWANGDCSSQRTPCAPDNGASATWSPPAPLPPE
jgi:hypothetical protein